MDAVRADQEIDAIARAEAPEPDPEHRYRVRRDEWRIVGPATQQPWGPCQNCGAEHAIDGRPIYTHGCRPHAMPLGRCEGFATYPITDDAVPWMVHARCPGEPGYRAIGPVLSEEGGLRYAQAYVLDGAAINRFVPHEHPEIEWV